MADRALNTALRLALPERSLLRGLNLICLSNQVSKVVTAGTDPTKRHDPGNPMADKNGDVWDAGVDSAAELVEMMETARQYQNNVQVLQTAKQLTLDTLRLDK